MSFEKAAFMNCFNNQGIKKMIFKIKLIGLLLNPNWFLVSISSNYFKDSSDQITDTTDGKSIRKIQHNYMQYSFITK
tara:strand:+ start:339 stop:569 length:231 start_codon:yes stop_codon:yes gene_type:complete